MSKAQGKFDFSVHHPFNTHGRGRTGRHDNLGLHWPPQELKRNRKLFAFHH